MMRGDVKRMRRAQSQGPNKPTSGVSGKPLQRRCGLCRIQSLSPQTRSTGWQHATPGHLLEMQNLGTPFLNPKAVLRPPGDVCAYSSLQASVCRTQMFSKGKPGKGPLRAEDSMEKAVSFKN